MAKKYFLKYTTLLFILLSMACSNIDRYGGGGRGGGRDRDGQGGRSRGSKSSTVRIKDVVKPLNCIKKSIAAGIPGGIRKQSRSRMVFFSKYVDLNGKKWDVLSRERWRAYAEVSILGDRRPYTLDVSVRVEERQSDDPLDVGFKVVGQSAPLAGQVASLIEAKMVTCRGDLIDDFRAF